MQARLLIYFLLFAVLPGVSYQYIQDQLRNACNALVCDWLPLNYILGVAPNMLGGLSLTAGFIALAYEYSNHISLIKIRHLCSLSALLGIWFWELIQLLLPKATFDWHDICWTIPGVIVAHLAAGLLLQTIPTDKDQRL